MITNELKEKSAAVSPGGKGKKRSPRKPARYVDELGEHLKRIYEKLGLTDEWDWVEKTLHKKFRTHTSGEGHTIVRDEGEFRIGTHAYNDKEFFLVMICGQLRSDSIEYLQETLETVSKYYEEYAKRALYGVIAAKELPEAAREEALKHGLFVGLIKNEKFILQTPPGFTPKDHRPPSKAKAGKPSKPAKPKKSRS